MGDIKIYIKNLNYPITLEGTGMDEENNLWTIVIEFKDKMILVQKVWNSKKQQILYSIPLNNLHYIDWGNV